MSLPCICVSIVTRIKPTFHCMACMPPLFFPFWPFLIAPVLGFSQGAEKICEIWAAILAVSNLFSHFRSLSAAPWIMGGFRRLRSSSCPRRRDPRVHHFEQPRVLPFLRRLLLRPRCPLLVLLRAATAAHDPQHERLFPDFVVMPLAALPRHVQSCPTWARLKTDLVR